MLLARVVLILAPDRCITCTVTSNAVIAVTGETGAILRAALQWSDAAASLCHLLSALLDSSSSSTGKASIHTAHPSAQRCAPASKSGSAASSQDHETPPKRPRLRKHAAPGCLTAVWQEVSFCAELTNVPHSAIAHHSQAPAASTASQSPHAAAAADNEGLVLISAPVSGHWEALAAACRLHALASPAGDCLSAEWSHIPASHSPAGVTLQRSSPASFPIVAAAAVACLRRAASLHLVSQLDGHASARQFMDRPACRPLPLLQNY